MSFMAVVAGGVGLATAGASIYGANKAASAQKKAAKGQIGLAREQYDRMDALQKELYGSQSKDIQTGYDRNNSLALAARNATMGQAEQLRQSGVGGAGRVLNNGRNYLGDLRDSSLSQLRADRSDNLGSIYGARDANMKGLWGARDAAIGETRDAAAESIGGVYGARDKSIGTTLRARDASIAGIGRARDESLAGFQPYYDTGTNALGAAAYNLGVGGKPKGYAGLELTPGAQYQLQQGRDTIEGGAAGSGNLYSGNTMAELEKMRNGEVSMDRDNQMQQLFGLAGMGQSAAGSMANLRSGAAGDIAGLRTGAARDIGGYYTGAAGDVAGLRTGAARDIGGYYTGAANGIADQRNWAAGAANSARDYNSAQQQGVQGNYATGMMGLDDSWFNRMYGANSDYANANTAAINGYGNQSINNTNNWLSGLSAARNQRANLMGSASQNYTNMASNAYGQMGQAGAAAGYDTANAISGGLYNGLDLYSRFGGSFGQNQPEAYANNYRGDQYGAMHRPR